MVKISPHLDYDSMRNGNVHKNNILKKVYFLSNNNLKTLCFFLLRGYEAN